MGFIWSMIAPDHSIISGNGQTHNLLCWAQFLLQDPSSGRVGNRSEKCTKKYTKEYTKSTPKKLGKTAGKIVELMRAYPNITIPEIMIVVQTGE